MSELRVAREGDYVLDTLSGQYGIVIRVHNHDYTVQTALDRKHLGRNDFRIIAQGEKGGDRD